MKMKRIRIAITIGLLLSLVAVAATYMTIQREIEQLKPRLAEYASLRYGLDVKVDDLGYAFPDGLRATGLRVSFLGKPMLEAATATFRIRLSDLFRNRSLGTRSLRSVDAEAVKVSIERSAAGGWLFPGPPPYPSRKDASTNGEEKFERSRVLFSIRGLEIHLATQRGAIHRTYDRLEALYDPSQRSAELNLRGGEEKLKIALGTGPERRVDVEADAVSLEPLLLFTSPVIPFDRLYLGGKSTVREISPGRYAFAVSGRLFGKGSDGSLKVRVNMEGLGTHDGLEEARGEMDLGGESMLFSATSTGGKRRGFQADATFRNFSFERAVASVPASFRPNLSDLKVTGYLNGVFTTSIATAPPYRTSYRFTGESERLRVLALGPGIRIAALRAPFRHTFRTEQGKTMNIWVGPDNPDFVPYGEIPPAMIKAAMSAEDGGFFRHRGFSIQQFIEALADNIRAGRVVRGASTITMQLAKNLYLPKARTLGRKFEELFITVALEQELSKRRILEIYMNIIEWGDGIYGLVPASRHYFRKHPSELTDEECAFLASIIARPRHRWRPDPLVNLGAGWRQYVDLLVRKMEEKQLPEEREPQ
jgi:hypothetical protein